MKKSISIIIFIICLIYAIVRYHIYKGVDYELFPTYTLNKALSFASLILFALTFLPNSVFTALKSVDISASKRNYSLDAYAMSALHLIITLFIISPELYPKFYSNGAFNVVGILTIVFGALSIFVFTMPFLASFSSIRKKLFPGQVHRIFKLARIGFILSLCHVASMGFTGWLDFSAWPSSLPPITLIAFVIGIICLSTPMFVMLIKPRRKPVNQAA